MLSLWKMAGGKKDEASVLARSDMSTLTCSPVLNALSEVLGFHTVLFVWRVNLGVMMTDHDRP